MAQQVALYAQGRTLPGLVVTKRDGVTVRSNHQPHVDGYGHAVDCAFLVDGVPSWAPSCPWAVYGAMVRHEGLVWGGGWTGFIDLPHAELPDDVVGVPV